MIIYKITNKINNKIYIGQTINILKKRWRQHCSTNSGCKNLHNAIRKYGSDNFVIEEIDGANSQSELNYKEWFLIHKFNSLAPIGYNLKEGGNNKKLSKITKDRIRKSNLGKKRTEQTKTKISQSKKGCVAWNKNLKGFLHKQETKEKMKKSWVWQSIEHSKKKVIDNSTNIVYESVTTASIKLNIPRRTLTRMLNKQTKTIKKYSKFDLGYYKEIL
jgi:group I intron endonuclease